MSRWFSFEYLLNLSTKILKRDPLSYDKATEFNFTTSVLPEKLLISI